VIGGAVLAVDLLEPFRYAFVRNGLIVAVLAGAVCGCLGVYVTLKSMSYIGHGLSHAIFGGAALGAVAGVNYFVAAGAWGLASALAVGQVTKRRIIGSDAAIGVITTASFALGIALKNKLPRSGKSTDALLFGSILGVSPTDVIVVAGACALVAVIVLLRYRALLFNTFDPDVAEVSGVNAWRTEGLLMVMLAAAILACMNVLGVTLIAATLVIPAVVARMVTSSFSTMLWLSTLIGAAAGGLGMYVSYFADISSGATIVLVGTAAFLVVYAATGRQGLRRAAHMAEHPAPDPAPLALVDP
jgi:manganese/iron transport system permease protein/iron/zinc/copper transport system permease protein